MTTYFIETAGETVTVVNSELAAIDADVKSNAEVFGHKWSVRTILFKGHLSLKEGSLRSSAVHLLWLSDHNRLVFEEVEDCAVP